MAVAATIQVTVASKVCSVEALETPVGTNRLEEERAVERGIGRQSNSMKDEVCPP